MKASNQAKPRVRVVLREDGVHHMYVDGRDLVWGREPGEVKRLAVQVRQALVSPGDRET